LHNQQQLNALNKVLRKQIALRS